jgi:hypothetical protein
MAGAAARTVARPMIDEFREVSDALGRAALVGAVAGLVAGGIGGALSRVAMRISGMLASPFLVTENGNVVGRITVGGSIGLVVGGAVAGVALGLAYVALRRWLPVAAWPRRLAAGVVAVGLLGALLVNDGNADFVRLGDPAVNVVMFAALLVVAGVVVAAVADAVDRRIRPRPDDPWFYSSIYLLITLVTVVFGPLAVVLGALPFVVLGGRTVAGRLGVSPSLGRGSAGWWIGELGLVGGVVAGLVLLGIEISEILA